MKRKLMINSMLIILLKNKTRLKQLLLLLFVFTFSAAIAFGQDCGDVDGNGFTDIVDALLVGQFYVNLNPHPFNQDVADVNCDGSIDIIDALLIAQFYVGLIDTLNCCESPTPTPDVTLEMQAEDAAWSSGGVESDNSGYTGSGYVNTDNAAGEWIEWTVDVDRDCDAICVFTYAVLGSDRPMDLSVNGSDSISLNFPDTGAWTTWATETADIILSADSNAIRLTATGSGGAPNMDKMNITIKGGPTDLSHTYFHKNIMIAVNHKCNLACVVLNETLKNGLPAKWQDIRSYIDEIEKRIAADDNDKIDAIEEAATFITGNWGSIRLKIDDEIDKAFPIDCEQDCHFIRFEQVYYCSTYVFLDVHELFEGEEFAFYVFVLALQLWAQEEKPIQNPAEYFKYALPPITSYIDHINPDWLLTGHNMIVGSPAGKAVGKAVEWVAADTSLDYFPHQFLTVNSGSYEVFNNTVEDLSPPNKVHVYILDTLPLIYENESTYNVKAGEIQELINDMPDTDPNHPAKLLLDPLPPYKYTENNLFKRIDSFSEDFYCDICKADILEYSDPDYNTPVPDHGIFIAGLIKSLAPEATIEILQTLNMAGVGSMKAFICALNYIDKNMDDNKINIINCSFGLKCSFQGAGSVYEKIVAHPWAVHLSAEEPLDTLMNLFSDTTVFASTGNHDSYESVYPAALNLDHVNGVGSLGIEGNDMISINYSPLYKIADYSNLTKRTMWNPETETTDEFTDGFYTPGGMIWNWEPADTVDDFNNRETSDKKGLLGLYLGDEVTGDPSVYAYWSGTSFAAPVVAGVFANHYIKGWDEDEVIEKYNTLKEYLLDPKYVDPILYDELCIPDIFVIPIIQKYMYDNRFCTEGVCPDE